jgi:hypothetical protein
MAVRFLIWTHQSNVALEAEGLVILDNYWYAERPGNRV